MSSIFHPILNFYVVRLSHMCPLGKSTKPAKHTLFGTGGGCPACPRGSGEEGREAHMGWGRCQRHMTDHPYWERKREDGEDTFTRVAQSFRRALMHQ